MSTMSVSTLDSVFSKIGPPKSQHSMCIQSHPINTSVKFKKGMQYRRFTRLWSSKDAEAECGVFTNLRFLYFFNSHFLTHLKTYQLIPLSQ